MNQEKENREIYYPDKDEIKAAQLACCGRHCTACESPAEYAWRKREVDMALLLEKAIKRELTEIERTEIMLFWFEGKTLSDIAHKCGVSPAAVKHTLDRAEEKLERALSYAVCYQQNIMNESIVPVVVGRARVIAAARNATEGNIGERIRRLRQGQCLTLNALGKATGINSSRILGIERGSQPDNSELIVLSEFFGVTTDYILKGEKNVRNKKLA